MKRQFYTFLTFLLVMAGGWSYAQTTISTTGISGNGTGSASPPPAGVCFNVVNTTGSAIVITEVGYSPSNTSQTELWYSSTSLTGNTTPIQTSSTSWTLLSTVAVPTVVATTVITTNFFSGLSLVMPANSTYRFAVLNATNVRYCATVPTQTVFTANGVNLDITNTLWGGATFSTGLSLTGRYYFGSITFVPAGPPCPGPTGVAATNVLSTSMTGTWNAVASSLGYEYIVDQNATVPFPNTPTATSATSFNKTGLTPSTNYYMHVRNKCGTFNFSPWVDVPFTTLPPCEPPVGFKTTNLQYTSTTINWNAWLSAQTYDYIVDQSNQDPTTSTGVTNTANTFAPINGLTENTWYYVHIRSRCAGGQVSSWSLDSFLTPIPCRPPLIKIDHINTDEAVAYWVPVPTATHYEYAVTTSSTPPALGTKYNYTSMHFSALYDGKDYYIHVRSHCNSIGIIGVSEWATASFKTFPTSVGNTGKDQLSIAAYPNPVRETLTVQVNGNRGDAATIQLMDITGKVLRTVKVTTVKTDIDMEGLAPGIYNVKYTDQSHNQVIKITKD